MDGNKDLISRAKLLAEIAKDRAVMEKVEVCDKSHLHFYLMGHDHVKNIVEKMPAAPIVTNAKWIPCEVDTEDNVWLWRCENCGEETEHKSDFCPVCGCEMTNATKIKG